jgi:hypothetical protein
VSWVGPDKDKHVLHLELDRKTYWALVKEAAETERGVEEYLEEFLNRWVNHKLAQDSGKPFTSLPEP